MAPTKSGSMIHGIILATAFHIITATEYAAADSIDSEQGQPYFRADYEDFLEVPEFVPQRHEEAPFCTERQRWTRERPVLIQICRSW
jgi:predicted outer membrane lipoprotein